MRIGYASADWGIDDEGRPRIPGGSGWARVHQLAGRLEQAGHTVGIGLGVAEFTAPGMAETGWLTPCRDNRMPVMRPPELLVCQRWMHERAADLTRTARAAGQVVIHDVDDWFWGLDKANLAHRTTSRRHNVEHNREHYGRAVAAATAVTVSTPFLGKRIRERFGVETILLRNVVDVRTYAPNTVRPVDRGLVVGWVGALQWRSGDLETLVPVLDGFLADTGSEFAHRGGFPVDVDTAATRAGVDPSRALPTAPAVVPWEYPTLLEGLDVGLVPLADVAFNRAKSWIKGLEYAAAGVPFVAAATEEYVELAHRGAGTVASTPGQWRAALEALTDPAERAWQRERGLEVARANDLSVRWREWETVYEALLARR